LLLFHRTTETLKIESNKPIKTSHPIIATSNQRAGIGCSCKAASVWKLLVCFSSVLLLPCTSKKTPTSSISILQTYKFNFNQ
jgi:hypothetical protein